MPRQRHIFLLEDEPLLRRMLAWALVGQGYQVLTGGTLEDGELFLRAMEWRWADLVICDANLSRDPDTFHGYLFRARWQALYPVPPFVFMHGHYHMVYLPDEESGRIYRISKPFVPSDLFRLVRNLLA